MNTINPPFQGAPAVQTRYNAVVHFLAVLTAAATLILIFMGGLVTSHGAGMAVPDWPNSMGYNMFLLPLSMWQGGILYEHTHRLAGSFVGMCTVALAIGVWVVDARRWVKWLAGAMLAGVIIQGVLGGLRVIWNDLDLAIVHACVAQAFFGITGLMAAATSRWWIEHKPNPMTTIRNGRLFRLAVMAAAIIYIEVIVGAVMRHNQAGLAIPDFPLSYGGILPPADADELRRVNEWRMQQPDLGFQSVTLSQIWIHFTHRVLAVIVAIVVAQLVVDVLRRHVQQKLLVRPAIAMAVLIALQITLGALTVLSHKRPDIATWHVAVGAACLFTAFSISARVGRLRGSEQPQAAFGGEAAGAVGA